MCATLADAMAHGNCSDLVLLALLGAFAQLVFAPQYLYQDFSIFKAQFKTPGADVDAVMRLCACLLLILGMMFSGVKWNPINGKGGGLAGILSMGYFMYSAFAADGGFVPRLLYAYSTFVLIGCVHIVAFPANPIAKACGDEKNNHGNWSDRIAIPLLLLSLAGFFYPDHLFEDIGPLKAQYHKKNDADLMLAIKFSYGLMTIVAMVLSSVKWNPINGKMSGLGGFIGAGYLVYGTLKADSTAIGIFYVYAAFLFFGALHIFAFPSNPKLKPLEDKSGKAKKN